jgi:predicted P-loop ATPase
MKPGEKVDTVLCLEGAQGLGKSTALRVLASPWFCDSKIDIANKDSWALAAEFWLIELAEAEGMTRAQAEALKGFFSKRDDTYRPPYGRTNATTLRRALFAVTTNAQRFLRFDPTGYRRFWPVTCGKLDLAALRADRDQILAEAVAAYRAGELWYFFPNTPEGQLAEAAARRREETIGEASQEIITDWLLAMPPEKRPKQIKVSELLTDPNVFGLQRHQLSRNREMEVADALRALGFSKYESWRGRAWKVPDDLLKAAQVTPIRSQGASVAPRGAENHA